MKTRIRDNKASLEGYDSTDLFIIYILLRFNCIVTLVPFNLS